MKNILSMLTLIFGSCTLTVALIQMFGTEHLMEVMIILDIVMIILVFINWVIPDVEKYKKDKKK